MLGNIAGDRLASVSIVYLGLFGVANGGDWFRGLAGGSATVVLGIVFVVLLCAACDPEF